MKHKKLKKLGKLLVVSTMAFTMCFASAIPTFAAQSLNDKDAVVTDNETSVTAAITKVLRTGQTTTTPGTTFTFEFEQLTDVTTDADGKTISVQQTDVPINPITASTTSAMTGTDDPANRVKTVEVETGDIFANVNYTKAGIYVYKVKEAATGFTNTDSEIMTYSQQEYTMYVYVANKDDGSGVYIQAVGTVYSKDTAGKVTGDEGVDPEVGSKVDPTPNPNPDDPKGEVDVDNSEMEFINDFVKRQGGDPDDPTPTDPTKQQLAISKTVTGDYGDREKYFDFDVTLKSPLVSTATVYNGYVVDAGNNVVTSTENFATLGTDDKGAQFIAFTLNDDGVATQKIKLKHGQKLVFTDVEVGTHFQSVETATDEYTESLVATMNGNVITGQPTALDSSLLIVGENTNSVAHDNKFEDITPTGILISNLPFILLILAAAGGITAYIIARNRRRQNMF